MNSSDISSSPPLGIKLTRRPSIHANENNRSRSKFNDSDKSLKVCEFSADVSNDGQYENNDNSINNASNTTQRSNKSHQSTFAYDSSRINDFTDEDYTESSDEDGANYSKNSKSNSAKKLPPSFPPVITPECVKYPTKAAEHGANIFQSPYFIVGLFLLLCCTIPYCFDHIYSNNAMAEIPNFDQIQESFHLEDDDLYATFKSGLSEVLNQNRPSTFIYLYEKKNEAPVNELVTELGKYAVSYLKNDNESPIVLTAEDLNSPQVIKDYGYVIHTYTPKLKEVGVMIIKHLENVRGISAQSFHSFCDQDNPSVEQSLFIFTMEVEGLPTRSLEFIEQYFKNKWSDIKPDAYQALITRMTNMVHNVSFL